MQLGHTQPATLPVHIREVAVGDVVLSVREWGTRGAPNAVLIPGAGLSAALFADVERLLAGSWHGYSVDRRGQGRSEKPDTGYDFHHFDQDLEVLVDTLEIRDALGIGHSAGGTDLMLAAGRSPEPWRRLIIIEPTVQDPRRPLLPQSDPSPGQLAFERTLRRRSTYPSLEAAVERFRNAPLYNRMPETALREYLGEALTAEDDGTVSLRCPVSVEAQMMRPIADAMEHRYRPPEGMDDPFTLLSKIRVPATVISTGHSEPVYPRMAELAAQLIPGATALHFADSGHLLPLEWPERVAQLAGPADV